MFYDQINFGQDPSTLIVVSHEPNLNYYIACGMFRGIDLLDVNQQAALRSVGCHYAQRVGDLVAVHVYVYSATEDQAQTWVSGAMRLSINTAVLVGEVAVERMQWSG